MFHIWFMIAILHTSYLTVRMMPHFKAGYEYYFWIGLWVFDASVLDEQGVRMRKTFIIITPIYITIGIFLAKFS